MRNPPELVVWDIDGTLAYPSLERQFVDFLVRTGRTNPARIAASALLLAWHWPPRVHRMKLPYVRQVPTDRVAEWVEAWWREAGERSLLPGASQSLRNLRDRGVEQLLLSGTTDFLAARLARHFGVTEVIAGRSEIVAGRYTGRLLAPHPHNRFKLEYAETFLENRRVPWERICALGDHEGDLFLLARSGLPVAVNPRPQLLAEARRRGWLVVNDLQLPEALEDLL